MTEEEIRRHIEEIDPEGEIPQSKIEELVLLLQQTPSPVKKVDVPGDNLQARLEDATDWRTKAAIAAQIISKNLE